MSHGVQENHDQCLIRRDREFHSCFDEEIPLCRRGGPLQSCMHTFARELRQAWRSCASQGLFPDLRRHADARPRRQRRDVCRRQRDDAAADAVRDRAAVVHLFVQPPGTTAVLQRNPLQQMEVPRLRERARTLARLEGFFLFERVVTTRGRARRRSSRAVTPGLLTMMAAPIAQGRSFTPGEGEPGHFVAVITRSLLARHPRRGRACSARR